MRSSVMDCQPIKIFSHSIALNYGLDVTAAKNKSRFKMIADHSIPLFVGAAAAGRHGTANQSMLDAPAFLQ